MPARDTRSSGQPFMDAAALATLLIEGPRYREQLVSDVRALLAPWLHPTVSAVLTAMDNLVASGAATPIGNTALAPDESGAPTALVARIDLAVDDGAPSLLPLAHLILAVVHPALAPAESERLEQRLVSAHERAFGMARPPEPRSNALHRRARHYRAALAGANLQLLEQFLHRVPGLDAASAGR